MDLIRTYIAAEEGSVERLQIERTMGRANIRKMVQRYEEEEANQQFLSSETTGCPLCKVKVQKSMGMLFFRVIAGDVVSGSD